MNVGHKECFFILGKDRRQIVPIVNRVMFVITQSRQCCKAYKEERKKQSVRIKLGTSWVPV